MTSIARYDRGEINVDASITDGGYIKANAIVTRSGVFVYRNPDGTIRREFRPLSEVSHLDSLESLKMIPITNGHPEERLVNSKNAKKLAIGYTGEKVLVDGNHVITNLLITDEDGVKAVREMGRKELSLGYTVDLIDEKGNHDGEDYDFIQTNIKYNHLSIVDKARAGSQARIALDRLDAEEIDITKDVVMTDKKTKRLKIDADEYMVEPEVFSDVQDLRDEVERLKKERDEKDRMVKDLEDEVDRLKAERDSLRDEKDMMMKDTSKNDEAEKFSAAVKARVTLEKQAQVFMNKDSLTKLDSMSDMDIKKTIVKSKFPNANLDSQSEIYINGRFDSVIESVGGFEKKSDAIMAANSKQDSSNPISAEDARQAHRNKTLNAYKTKK